MIVYAGTKKTFMIDSDNDALVNQISDGFRKQFGKPKLSEVRAWTNSLLYMYKVINNRQIPDDVGVAIEFKLPGSSKRVDFIISGRNNEHQEAAVIIELKQWETVQAIVGAEALVNTYVGGAMGPHSHPSYQAWSYASFFQDYCVEVNKRPVKLAPCAYLHNYTRKDPDELLAPQYKFYTDSAPTFMKGEIDALRNFIHRYIRYGDNKETLYIIENSEIRPSKSLQDHLSSMLKGNREFILIDSQMVVYEMALLMSAQAQETGEKQVLIVEGGPGTGKSVVAINLLVELTKRGMVAQYVTKNAAPRHVYQAKLSRSLRKGRISNLFQTAGAYTDAPPNGINVLISDESHRLTDKSGMFRNQGEDQIKEIICAAQLSVFFIDESQRVTIHDYGSVEKIEAFAAQFGAKVQRMQLDSQFRCNGSDGYIAWLDDVLDIHEAEQDTAFRKTYDFRICDTPNEVRDLIFDLNRESNKARLLAGYCWEWNKNERNDPEHADIRIPEHDFNMSWNLGNTSTWAIDPESVIQVGCIHTS
ncbi:MAG: DUF2075 domain-containing protein, partial [Clostridiales bacterium]|nr:DUF2075 domain-containing protein [Clostridiales bacterium]